MTSPCLPAPPLTYRFCCHDGSIKWIYTEIETIFDDDGNPIRRIGTNRDVTEVPLSSCFEKTEVKGDRVIAITYQKDRVNAGEVLAALGRAGFGVVDVSTREADLEDVFLSLTSSRAAA